MLESLVPNAILAALELREEAGRPPLETVTEYLRTKTLFLVLDNCEHLIEACARVGHYLLTHCPKLQILATSREVLGVAGEVTYQVPALSIPDPKQMPAPDTLSQFDAVHLFIERALAVNPNFTITNANAPAVAQICSRLDGIPLAIELAAARIKLFSPEEIVLRLDDRLRLLTGGSRIVMPRQQTLRATIEWSFSLLSDAERILFRRLSVFAGGWSFEAAEGVCAGDALDVIQVLDVLTNLVDKSLVTTKAAGDETRYALLETIQEFALQEMNATGETQALHTRHLEYFIALAERAEQELQGAGQHEWMERLDVDYANLRAALEWSLAQGDAQSALRLASALHRFWVARNHVTEGSLWLAAALSRDNGAEFTPARAQGLSTAALLATAQGEYPAARLLHQQGLDLWRLLEDKSRLSAALANYGMQNYHEGKYELAKVLMEEGLALARALNDKYLMARNLLGLARVANATKDSNEKRFYQECLDLNRDIHNDYGVAVVLADLSVSALSAREYSRAISSGKEALVQFQKLKDERWIAWTQSLLGEALFRSGDHEQAVPLLCTSLRSHRDSGDKSNLVELIWLLGTCCNARKEPDRGTRLLAASITIRNALEIARTPEETACATKT